MKRAWLPVGVACFLLLLLAPVFFARAATDSLVLISGVYYDPFVSGEASEAVQIQNVGGTTVPIGEWTLSDGEGIVTFPEGAILGAGQKIWVSKTATAFLGEFGYLPDYEYGGDSD